METKVNPFDLVVYHVGGSGGYGPAARVSRAFKQNTTVILFEAREGTENFGHKTTDKITVINRCIDETAGTVKFNVNKHAHSSSILKGAKLAEREDPGWPHVLTWAENVELEREAEFQTVSMDEFVKSEEAPAPDVLSIDAQGAEMRILRGSAATLSNHILALITEVEFSEIYEGQGLFDEQMTLLRKDHFRLVELENMQRWHPGAGIGHGFLTVAEALWIRYVGEFDTGLGAQHHGECTPQSLVRLAMVAFAFERLSYCIRILDLVKHHHPLTFYEAMEQAHLAKMLRIYDHLTSEPHGVRLDVALRIQNNRLIQLANEGTRAT